MQKLKWWLPLIAFILFTPFSPSWDLSVSQYFYDPVSKQFSNDSFSQFLYVYGPYPGNTILVLAALTLILSYFFAPLKKWRASSLLLFLTMVLGSGFITNALLKDHWGRPRPKQVIEFGGAQEFRPYYSPNFFHQPEPSKSFPCGHCSTGFFFFVLVFLGNRLHKRWLSILGFSLAAILGILMGIGRIAQGGHFLSDVAMSALIMWYVALICDWMIYTENY